MKNKILKVFLILSVLFFMVFGGVFAFIIYSLPSTKSIARVIAGPDKKTFKTGSIIASQDQTVIMESIQASSDQASVRAVEEKKSQTINRKGLDNLIDPNVPLSQFCNHLKNAKNVSFKAAEFNSEFQKSADEVDADPRIQAVKPLFRTIFREPKMKDLILEAQSAVENKDENFWQKAAFYSKAALAFQSMIANKSELEAVSDRSYLFFKMNELVSQKPELLNDQRLQKFCADTENAFNTNQPVQFDQEKKNFERLLDEFGISQADLKYDPDYKTKFDISFDGKSLQIKGGWLEDLVSESKSDTK